MQERVEEIEVRIVPAATFAPSDVDRLEHELRARLGPAIGIRYTTVDDIPPGRNGKVKFVVSAVGGAGSPAPGSRAVDGC